ncbi:MAG: butyrate kinase [Bacillota bacterium]
MEVSDEGRPLILVINPGSTSTKVAVFAREQPVAERAVFHRASELAQFRRVLDQLEFRKHAVMRFLEEQGISISQLDCVVARCGLVGSVESGTYLVDEGLCRELMETPDEHASNLGPLLAQAIARAAGISAYMVDPPTVDELEPLARVSGLKGIERRSVFHALNQKAIAHKAAALLGKPYEECNMIVAHMGGGISVGAHRRGRVVDVNNALEGEGPFSPERAGGLPVGSVIQMCYQSGLTEQQLRKRLVGCGGLVSYLGTNNAQEVEDRISKGDSDARTVYEAMAYQIAKEIGGCAAVLKGDIDAIVLTGGLAYSERLVGWIKERVGFLGRIMVFPGEGEMEALVEGALRVLTGNERPKVYRSARI